MQTLSNPYIERLIAVLNSLNFDFNDFLWKGPSSMSLNDLFISVIVLSHLFMQIFCNIK